MIILTDKIIILIISKIKINNNIRIKMVIIIKGGEIQQRI